MKHPLRFLLPAALAIIHPALAADTPTPRELQEKLYNLTPQLLASTVSIQVGEASGSGVIVSPEGLILTAAHVTGEPGSKIRVLLSDGRDLEGTALGVDHTTDAGIARIDSTGPFPYQPYVKDATYQVGDWVIATGHPGGPHAYRPSPVRLGQINKAGTKGGFQDPITTTATVISGDSGGPLFDLEGRVIGINSNISGDWNTNNHVPLPSFITVWDRLMNSEKIESEQSPQTQLDIDDPYKAQRDFFYRELAERPDDPAAYLLKRPELLDPNHIQEHLNRWARNSTGDEPFDPLAYPKALPLEQESRPYLGVRLGHSDGKVIVLAVEPDSPTMGQLEAGDMITSINDTPITSIPDFAHSINNLDFNPENPRQIVLTISRGDEEQEIVFTPVTTPDRLHFSQPLAVLTDRMMSRAPAVSLTETLQSIRENFLAQLPEVSPTMIPLVKGNRRIVLATAITSDGFLLSKTSEIINPDGTLKEDISAKFGGNSYPFELIESDPATDLSVIKIDARDLVPVAWYNPQPPGTATLVVSPQPDEKAYFGITTQPIRSAPKSGYDHILTLGKTPPYLGVTLATFSANPDHPTVSLVESGSPADAAGVLEGDLIIDLEGEEIKSAGDITNALKKKQPGERIDLTVKRGEQDVDLKAILGKRTINSNRPSPRATRTDQALSQLSANGGSLSKRRQGFPVAIYHDTPLQASQCGGPLLNLNGELIGINISRSLRQRSLALPVNTIRQAIKRMKIFEASLENP